MKKITNGPIEAKPDLVEECLTEIFESAFDIFIDPVHHECEVTVSESDFKGAIDHDLVQSGIRFTMIDFSDVSPFKYVFSYTPA